MKKSITAFLTTIFPVSELLLYDFFNSLQKQTYTKFDVIVVNDGVGNFEKTVKQYLNLNIIEFKANYSPAKNREFGIKKVLELGYEYIIFGDSDDYFEGGRIKHVINLLKNEDFVINDLAIFNKKTTKHKFLSEILKKDKLDINYFLNKNIAGLSNTAIKTSLLNNTEIKFDDELIAVDWYFFTTLLLQNIEAKVYFTNKTNTYYRQYEQNTIGLNDKVSPDKIKLGIKVKLIHYKQLINFCKKKKIYKFISIFESGYKGMQILEDKINNKDFLNRYVLVIKNNFHEIFTGWWSEIITFEQFKYYENKNNNK